MWPMAMFAGQAAQHLRREDIGDVAHGFVAVNLAAVARGDAGAFLAAMLQRIQAQIGEVGGFGMAVDGEDAAFLVEFVERQRLFDVSRVGVKHRPVSATPRERSPKPRGSDRRRNPPM